MRAITVTQPGGPEQLSLTQLETPRPGPGELLIRVQAAGINRADLLQRQGHYPPPPGASPLLGLEVSGEVVSVGPEVAESSSTSENIDSFRPGDRVCALLAGGGYAEYAVASTGSCLPVPEAISLVDAAALPEAIFTVWANLFSQAPGQATAAFVRAGERLLVQGGTSGIGSMALQMARARGIVCLATAGSPEKCAKCLEFGAEFAADYHQDWAAQIRAWSREGVDCILDMVAGPYFAQHLDLLAPAGRLSHIATAQGASVELDLRTVMKKRLVITGSHLRSRSAAAKRQLRDEIAREIWPLVTSGSIHPVVHQRYPLAEAAEAHRSMEQGGHIGKLLLLPCLLP
jgi:NADPH2:quinone reductase